MKALVYAAPERMELQEVPDPAPAEGEVLLQIAAAGVCGSDLHGFLGHSERRKPGLVMGHESIATVLEAHTSVSGWPKGQRVCFNPLLTCRRCRACLSGRPNLCASWTIFGMDRLHGTYAERVAVPARQLFALSDGLSDEEAILAEPMAVVLHAFRVAFAGELPRSLVIVGGGAIGCLSLVLARLRGIPKLVVIDVNEARLQAAQRLGAHLVIDARTQDGPGAAWEFTEGGAEGVIEAVGSDASRRIAVDMAAKGARLLFLGLAENESPLPWIDMVRNEQAIFTSFCYAPRDFEDSVRLLESRQVDIRAWTESRPLADGQAGFLKMARNPGATLKLMLKP
jgi:threonine dehydrogenase-like Zn-dependent dehydrogenase